jgi:trehalose/maltose hydrolase-like predicted phosphorylase
MKMRICKTGKRLLAMFAELTLDGAKKKAKSYGFDGAFYAWESREGGYDACSDYNVVDVFTSVGQSLILCKPQI